MSGIVRANNSGQSGAVSNIETIDSDDYVDGSIDNAHIADDAIDSEHYAAGSIDNAHLADDAVDSDELAAGAVDTAHIGDNQVTAAKIFDLARGSVIVGNSSAATAELTIGSNTYVLASDGTDIAWTAASSGPSQATQSALEATTNEDTYAPPDLMHHHPGVAKAWLKYAGDLGTIYSGISYNITSITDEGTGDFGITIATDFSGAEYVAVATCSNNCYMHQDEATPTAGVIRLQARSDSGTRTDTVHTFVAMFGDQ